MDDSAELLLDVKDVLEERKSRILVKSIGGCDGGGIRCDRETIAGSISQRACVYCGARVVLNPITDAVHLVHGPIGCASYTWDLRGSLTSDSNLFRNSFSTDLREKDVIFGGEKKLAAAIDEIIEGYTPRPKLIFVYATCVVGVIGDDIEAVCRQKEAQHGVRVIPVKSSGFVGAKPMGYKLACGALLELMGDAKQEQKPGVNILGDYNHGGEIWIIEGYLRKIGVNVVARITGDSSYEQLIKAPSATLNIVECSGSMAYLSQQMEKKFGIPSLKVRFIGYQDIKSSLVQIAEYIGGQELVDRALRLVEQEEARVEPIISEYRKKLAGKTAAVCVGGTYKAIAMIQLLKEFGVKTVLIGTQHGSVEDYRVINDFSVEGAVIINDTSPTEIEKYVREFKPDLFVGNVKERTLALKMGIPFVDFNHDRKYPMTTYEGMINFIRELDLTSNSPVWKWANTDPLV
ncbi:nitrogenase iron-molybdenum cofactor biosynthesis protein NifE [Fundidesulfovibrio putealis]|uniref:nitrogenase iron-molybdenum cofactor biosynthesis protein NifE n=1 Tax=Fundidesulfovibrio putealis TaxID=270496 RepID=UPI00041426BF|nr:nitrogenase iron-molybdenum cofactor biosynthesis protein NifE [Fundidesulfovibrio putealis]